MTPQANWSVVWDLFYLVGYCLEIRIVGCGGKSPAWAGYAGGLASGYFNDKAAFIAACAKLDQARFEAAYITMNPVQPELIARANNRIIGLKKGDPTTHDNEVAARRWMLIDVDPRRSKGISSTDKEIQAARATAMLIKSELEANGWAGIVEALSGNGIHLLLRIDMPNDEATRKQLHAFYAYLSDKYTDDKCIVDPVIFNAARVVKLYGTMTRKGDPTPDRPHRRSTIIELPPDIAPNNNFDFVPRQPERTPAKSIARNQDDYALIESILQKCPAHFGDGSYETWLSALMAVHSKLGDAGIALCERYIPGKPGEIEAKFASFNGHGVSLGTLVDIGKRFGWTRPEGERQETYEDGFGPGPSESEILALMSGEYTDSLPVILVNGRQESAILSDAINAIVRRNRQEPARPVVYIRESLVRIIESGEQAKIQTLNNPAMRVILAQSADWMKQSKGDEIDANVPEYLPGMVLQDAIQYDVLPFLDGLSYAPTFARSGRLHDQPGYSADTRLYYTKPVRIGEIAPSRLPWAKQILLNELFSDFPFANNASLAHTLALLLLPFVRPMIMGPTPLHLIDAPTPGTGKSLLATLALLPSHGDYIETMSWPENEDDRRKTITSRLSEGATYTLIDNIPPGDFKSAILAQVVTAPVHTDRRLGVTQSISIPVRAIWIATGNNLQPDSEIARRCIWIRLDAGLERPHTRTEFRHENIMEWAQERRSDLITAALILVQSWLDAGRPLFKNRQKGSFESWARIIGGILQNAGIPGFLENEDELYEFAGAGVESWKAFIVAWYGQHGTAATHTGDLFTIASHPDRDAYDGLAGTQSTSLGLLDEELGAGNEASRQRRLGHLLKGRKDTVIAGCKILRATMSGGKPRWKLSVVDQEALADAQKAIAGDEDQILRDIYGELGV